MVEQRSGVMVEQRCCGATSLGSSLKRGHESHCYKSYPSVRYHTEYLSVRYDICMQLSRGYCSWTSVVDGYIKNEGLAMVQALHV